MNGKEVKTVIVEKQEKGGLYGRFVNGIWGWYKSGDEKKDGKYVGDIENGEPNGVGVMTYPSGKKYEGEWSDVKKNGKGTLTTPNGYKYVGEYKDDNPNGQGTYTSTTNGILVGELKDG